MKNLIYKRFTMKILKRLYKEICFILTLFLFLLYVGVFTQLIETDFKHFEYPYEGDIEELVAALRQNQTPKIPPINNYNFNFFKNPTKKCLSDTSIRLVYLIKSDPEHFEQRNTIRRSWGYQQRFSDVEIRTVFLLGTRTDLKLQHKINLESHKHSDLVQANFSDAYYNNTLKTMAGITWAFKHCPNAKFYMFADDDYYVSTKNVLRFVRNPANYPNYLENSPMRRKPAQYEELDEHVRLYAGYALENVGPIRAQFSKWYVPLAEYPYSIWPKYITAGAYILSKKALEDIYFGSHYTKHFRFDDIYMAFVALKARIQLFHSDAFYMTKPAYLPANYKFLIATHGYENGEELERAWNEQKSLGNA